MTNIHNLLTEDHGKVKLLPSRVQDTGDGAAKPGDKLCSEIEEEHPVR